MQCANATELYIAMYDAIRTEMWERQCTDPESVQTNITFEAKPGREFELRVPHHNVQICVPFDPRWAIANTLHFFAGTEEAGILRTYHPRADQFLTNNKWRGAYGAIAMPQVQDCITRLCDHPQSRRAIISMGGSLPQDMHRPACWSFLQFLRSRSGLCLVVYQRSLNLSKVMPYDLIVLSNLLLYVAKQTKQPVGSLLWTIGSLHSLELTGPNYYGQRNQSIRVECDNCIDALQNPNLYPEVWKC